MGDALGALDRGVTGNTTAIANLDDKVAKGAVGPVQRTGEPGRFALVAPDGTGAVPGRAQVLTNVAGGKVAPGSTEAVNGDQLAATEAKVATTDKKAADAQDAADTADKKAVTAQEAAKVADEKADEALGLGTNSVQYADGDKKSITLGGQKSDDGGKTDGTRLSNLAQGSLAPNSTDAVNGAQLLATNQAVADGLGGGAKLNPDGSVAAPTYAIHNPGSTTATTTHGNVGDALGALDKGVTGNTAAIADLGRNAAQYGKNADGSPNTGEMKLAGGTDAAGNPTGTAIRNVAPGSVAAGSMDAVNGGQLHDVAQTAGKSWQLSAQGANASQVKPGDTVDISGADDNIRVAKGADDRDVKVALSRDLALNSVTAGGTVLNGDGVTIAGGANGPVKLGRNGLDNGGNALTGVGAGRVAPGSTDAVTGDQLAATEAKVATADDKAATAQQAADTADEKAVKAQEAADLADGKAVEAQGTADKALGLGNNSVQYADADKRSIMLGGPVSADGGRTGGTRLSNLAQGSLAPNSTDAVNGAQLRAMNQALANGLGGGAKLNDDGTLAAPTYAIHNPGSTKETTPHNNVGDALGALDKGVTQNTGTIDKLGRDIANGAIGPVQQSATPGQVALVAPGGTGAAPGAPQLLTNVAPGAIAAGSTDAVNGGQLHDVAQTAGKGWQLSAQGANASQVKPGDTVDLSGADANIRVAKGADDRNVTIALSRDLSVDSVRAGDTVLSKDGVAIAGGPNGPVTLSGKGLDNGGNVLTGVGGGQVAPGSRDAVNGDQLAASAQSVADALGGGARVGPDGKVIAPQYVVQGAARNNVGEALLALDDSVTNNGKAIASLGDSVNRLGNSAVHYDKDASGAPNTGSITLAGGKDAVGNPTGTVIRNVAPGAIGAGSTEAVNGAQLHDTNQQVAQNATNVAGNTRAIETLKEGQSASSNQIANLSQGIEDGTVGLVRQEGGSPGNGRITLGGMTGGNSISLAGTSGNRKLSGVADGTAADDAVNVSQLAAAISTASMNDVRYDGADRGSVTFNAGGAPTGLRNVAAGRLDADSNDAVTGGQLHATNRQVASHMAQLALLETGQGGAFRANNSSALPVPNASGADAVAGGFGAVASGARSTAIGANAVASGVGSVALGHGSTDGGRDNVVSVGSEGAERQIANVAAGTRPTDAANLEQMNSAVGNALGSANAYTDHHIKALGFNLANVRRDADAGTASAMAMAGLPQAFGEGGGMIGGAIGVYQNETAIALGASKVFNDGRTVVKGGATYVETSRGSTFGANVGIGYQF